MKLREYSSYIIAFCATIVRYYDYALFGLSASVISQELMPGESDSDQMLIFFAVFSIAVGARPAGSIVFGKIGDRISRVASVKIATVIAAISTSMIALVPSFDTAGWFAVILLTACRMMFLMSLAGEVDAIKIYVSEKIGNKKRYFASGIVSFSSQIGVLLAAFMYHMTISIDEALWLWRMNFALGGFLGLFVILMRGYFQESEAFLKSKARHEVDSGASILTIIKTYRVKFALATIVNGMLGGGYHFLIIFLGTFAANVADIIQPEQATSRNVMLIATYGAGCLASGYIADKVKMASQITVAFTLCIICILSMEFFLQMDLFAHGFHQMLCFIVPFYTIPCAIKIQSLFPSGVRMRMFSLSHSLGSMVFSSTTPFICMVIWKMTGLFSLVLAYFLCQVGVLFFAMMYIMKKEYASMFES